MRFTDATSFRTAIEQRLRNDAGGKPENFFDRRRKMIVFDRYLARLLEIAPGQWVLKGGTALNFRLQDRPRTTVDLDLGSTLNEEDLMETLLASAELEVGDYFSFVLERVEQEETDELAGTLRFRAHASLADRPFETVKIDVNVVEPLPDVPEIVSGLDFLQFANLPSIEIPVLPLARHLAEKLHAYTRIYGSGHPSSRVKDLIDIVLVSKTESLIAGQLRSNLQDTFESRNSHDLPMIFPSPTDDWQAPYRLLALEVDLEPTLQHGIDAAAALFDPVLSGTVDKQDIWNPERSEWESP